MDTNRIEALAPPQLDSDAANKKYVDNKHAELTASNLNINGNNVIGLPTTSTGLNDNSAAISWGALLETLTPMDANLVHKAGDTMTGQLNAKTVVVDGKLSDGSTAGWSLSVNNGYLRMNNKYIATRGTAFANNHATNRNYVDNLSYTQSINGFFYQNS